MMNSFFEWISRLASSWKCWIVVPPWDTGVRVRLGKIARSLPPGLHLRIPGLDEIALVNTRLRVESTPAMTLSNGKPGWVRTTTATIGYRVVDPLEALMHYTEPGQVLVAMAQRWVTRGSDAGQVTEQLRAEVQGTGIAVEWVYFAEQAEVKCLRLMQGGGGAYVGAGALQAPPCAPDRSRRY